MVATRLTENILWMGQRNPKHQLKGGIYPHLLIGFQVSTILLVVQDISTIHNSYGKWPNTRWFIYSKWALFTVVFDYQGGTLSSANGNHLLSFLSIFINIHKPPVYRWFILIYNPKFKSYMKHGHFPQQTVKLPQHTLWLTNYWKWPFIVDLPIKHGDFP